MKTAIGPFDSPGAFSELLQDVDVVVHAASATTPGSSCGQPLRELEENLRPTLALLSALQDFPGRRLVFLSSGGTLYGDVRRATESTPLRPRSYYGAAKAAAEHFIHAWTQQHAGTAIILRPSNVYGPGQPSKPGFGIIPAALDCARTGQRLVVWGDGSAVRDYLFVEDLVELVGRVVEEPGSMSGCHAYNAAFGRGTSLDALLACLESVTGKEIRREYRPARQTDVGIVVPDSTRACEVFDWKPSHNLEEGLKKTWRWFAGHP